MGLSPKLLILDYPKYSVNQAEAQWIRELKERGEDLTNLQDGGQGGWEHLKLTPEQRHERNLKSAKNRSHEIYVQMGKKGGSCGIGSKKPGTARAVKSRWESWSYEKRQEMLKKMHEGRRNSVAVVEHCRRIAEARRKA